MKSIDLNTLRTAWKNEKAFTILKLSEAEIQGFLSKRSRDISQHFRLGLIMDLVLKSLVGISFIGILILFRENLNLILMIAVLLLGVLWTMRYQWLLIGKIPEDSSTDPVIRTSLENKLAFYHRHYKKALYVGALSNALLILSGILYYFHFKYGEIRPIQWDDYLVFGASMVLGFGLGAFVQIKQFNFQIKQLESCLQEIDEETISTFTLRDQRNKKRRLLFIFLLALAGGLLLLALFIFR